MVLLYFFLYNLLYSSPLPGRWCSVLCSTIALHIQPPTTHHLSLVNSHCIANKPNDQPPTTLYHRTTLVHNKIRSLFDKAFCLPNPQWVWGGGWRRLHHSEDRIRVVWYTTTTRTCGRVTVVVGLADEQQQLRNKIPFSTSSSSSSSSSCSYTYL